MQATTAENEDMKSSPLISKVKVSVITLMKYRKMKASTANTMLLSTTWPPIFNGLITDGCNSLRNSRPACFTSIRVRIILMPPPVEPELHAIQLRNSIHNGAKIGHWLKSTLAKPQSVAKETRLKLAWRNAVQKAG